MLGHLQGTHHLVSSLLYGSGLRLLEGLHLRVKDVEFTHSQIIVRDGKGQKDRVTVLPESLAKLLKRQLKKVKLQHEEDLDEGYGTVYLPYALAQKYPVRARSWGWQYVFPSSKRSKDPRSGVERRHHLSEKTVQKAVHRAVKKAGLIKPASCNFTFFNCRLSALVSEFFITVNLLSVLERTQVARRRSAGA